MQEWASGIGYDIHRVQAGRKLILAGVEIPWAKGLNGHSDADVMTHALMDALLGAAGLPDIGVHFPPSDEQWRNADSLHLLARVMELVAVCGWQVGNVDIVLIAEAPRIGMYRDKMKERLARVLGIDAGRVGIKATTNEGLGALGSGEGMAAWATVMLHREEA